jgi:hypothetical protein
LFIDQGKLPTNSFFLSIIFSPPFFYYSYNTIFMSKKILLRMEN